jgi:hypothetical protein
MLQMGSESSLTKQDTNMKVNGKIIWPTEEDRQSTVMKASTMENSSTTKGMAMAC